MNDRIPCTKVSEMAPNLRANFRYDIRSGMTYENLRQKYIVSCAAIAKEKRLLGLPVKSHSMRGRTQATPVASKTIVADGPTPTPNLAINAANQLRSALDWLVKAGYSVEVSNATAKIQKVETL